RRPSIPRSGTERKGRPEAPLSINRRVGALRREIPVDVLVDSAVVRAEIAAPELDLTLLRLDASELPALVDVGRRRVLVLRGLARIRALHGVPPVRPCRV